MVFSVVIGIAWFVHIVQCYYLTRPINHMSRRIILTLLPCVSLCYITCIDLPLFETSSIVIVAFCWLTSIRLIGLTIFVKNKTLTFKIFLFKIFWIYFPIIPTKSEPNQWSIKFYPLLILLKLLINHWIYRWCLRCQSKVYTENIFLFFISLITISYLYDFVTVYIRILTLDQYTLKSFTNNPFSSISLREFWGYRYNRLMNSVLKESIFQPISSELSSPVVGSMTTFMISGLFHVHMAFLVSGDKSHLFPTFLFFLLNGIACYIESIITIPFPKFIRCLITNGFLLLTAPLVLEPFIGKGHPFLVVHPPPYFHVDWFPKVSAPDFCLF